MDSETRRVVAAFEKEVRRLSREVETLRRGQRTPQLSHSSIESGSLDVIDPETEEVRLRIGHLPDGTVGMIAEGGDPPPRPSAPQVAAGPAGVISVWDGLLEGDETGDPLPADLDHVSVHAVEGDLPDFTPSAATFQGTIPRAGGAYPIVPLPVGVVHTVRLVAVTTSGVEGEPSVAAVGTPEAVGGVPEPGSITEIELADGAVTAPKVRAEAIEAWHIVAQAIETGHLQAQAVTASKLAAEIVLASRLIAGNPGADRAEIDNHGIKVYNASGELILTTEGGNLTLTGNIVGSQISGSRFVIATTAGTSAAIEEAAAGLVRTRMDAASGARAQLQSSPNQAEFSVWGNVADPTTPSGGVVAVPGGVQLSLYSNAGSSLTNPAVLLTAIPGRADGLWRAGDGSEVRLRAVENWASIEAQPPPSTTGQPAASPGFVYAFRRSPSDAPTVSVQSPMTASGPGAGRRSIIHVEGATTARPSTVINHASRQHYFQGELVDGATDTTTDGVVQLAATHSIAAPKHTPVVGELLGQLTGYSTGTDFFDFPAGTFAPFTFKTGWSGRVRFTINMCGLNPATAASSIALGFRLTGAGTLGAHLSRSAFVRSIGAATGSTRQSHWSKPLALLGNAEYTLTPCYRITSGTTATFDLALDTSIIVEPLM